MSDLPIRSVLLLLSWLSLLGLQYTVFLPIFANDILQRGARGLGLLMSAGGVGAVLGALHFAARTEYRRAQSIAMSLSREKRPDGAPGESHPGG